MYLRPVHSDLDPQVCHDFVKANPLGLLITHLPSADPTTPIHASHIPFVIDAPVNGFQSVAEGARGVLRGHMARANPQSKAIIAATTPTAATGSSLFSSATSYLLGSSSSASSDILTEDVMVVFTSPTHSYVTPTFYTTTKPDTHKVVPTWDYAAVQVYGKLRLYNKGEEAGDFLQTQVEDLTRMEEERMQQKCPAGTLESWAVDQAPKSYVELLKKGIIGIAIQISRIEGKFKMSQENDLGDWEGVVDGFKSLGTEDGRRMAEAVEDRGKDRERTVKEGGVKTDHELSSASLEEAK